jgi:hypothetical protein
MPLPCISRHPLAKPSLADQPGLLRFAPTVLVKRSKVEAASSIELNCAHSQRSFTSDKKAEGRENLHGTLFAFAHTPSSFGPHDIAKDVATSPKGGKLSARGLKAIQVGISSLSGNHPASLRSPEKSRRAIPSSKPTSSRVNGRQKETSW